MPTVPRALGLQAVPAPIPGARIAPSADLAAFGGGQEAVQVFGVARGLAQQAEQIAEAEIDRANRLRVSEEKRAGDDWEFTNLYDQKTGAFRKLGKNSFGLEREVLEGYDKFFSERRRGLANRQQQEMFDESVANRREQVRNRINAHIGKQTKAVEEAEYGAGLESSKRMAAVDPSRAKINFAEMSLDVLLRGEAEGWPRAVIEQELLKHETDLHVGVIESLISKGNHAGAAAYFRRNASRMDPGVANKIKLSTHDATVLGESQRVVDDIFTLTQTKGPPKTLGDALEKAEEATKGMDPQIVAKTKALAKERYAERQAVEKENQENLFNLSMKGIEENGGNLAPYIIAQRDMAPGAWEKLETHARNIRQGVDPVTDQKKLHSLTILSASDPQAFVKENLTDYTGILSRSDFEGLTKIKADIIKKGTSDKSQGYLTTHQLVDAMLQSLKVDTNPGSSTKDAKILADFRIKINTAMDLEQKKKKEPLTLEEIEKVVNQVFISERGSKSSFWSRDFQGGRKPGLGK